MMFDRFANISIRQIIVQVLLVTGAAIMLLPFAWMVSTSLKTGGAVFTMPPSLIPQNPTLENYVAVFESSPMARFILNSVFVSSANTFLVVFFSATSGYAFARIQFKGREFLFYGYLATMMVPQQVTLTPLFIIMNILDWSNTYQALILPTSFSAFGTFLMRQFFMGMPQEIEDAAKLDGAGHIAIFFKIALHLSKPALATLSIFAFMASWNSFLWPLIITSDTSMMTLPLGLSFLQGRWTTDWNVLMAGTVIGTLPVLSVYVFTQKYIIKGLSHTGSK